MEKFREPKAVVTFFAREGFALKKIFRMVRFTLFCFFLGLIQVMALDSYSQQTRISLNQQDQRLEEVFKTIEDKSEFFFLYNRDLINVDQTVNINVTNQTITSILDKLLKETDISYSLVNRQIILSNLKGISGLTSQQPKSVSGKVTDSSGASIPGVSVVVKGTTQGTVSNANGEYTLNNIQEDATLVFSFVGMHTHEVVVGRQTTIDTRLEEETIGLGEVVAIGYGTQKLANLTGSLSTVNVEALGNRPATDIASVLQGISPGLNIKAGSSLGGEPGSEMDIDIRGIGSLSGGGPYILVDGVPMALNRVSPNEIQSVTVLKDAAAAAIYGARAAFGVVLITTKRGQKNKKAELTYSNNFGFRGQTTVARLANSLDYAHAMNYAAQNSGANAIFNDEMIQHIINYQNDPENYPGLQPIPGNENVWAGTGGAGGNFRNANTQWHELLFKDDAFQQNHNLSLNGGTENTAYYMGLDFIEQEGLMNFADDKYSRYNLTSNLSVDPTSWLTVTLRTKFSHSDNKYPVGQATSASKQEFFTDLPRVNSVQPLYTPDGDLSWNYINILVNGGKDRRWENRLTLTPEVEIRLSNEWDIIANFNYQTTNRKSLFMTKKIYDYLIDGTPVLNYLRTFDMVQREIGQDDYLSSNIYSTFTKQLEGHFIKLMIGGQVEESKYESLNGWKRDLVSTEVESIRSATGTFNVSDNLGHWSTLGIFGRFNYNFEEKYLIEINSRYDGSSRFGSGKRWGFFPSASIGYAISKENFWESLESVINNLKFRASYGSLGNQNVANYLHYVLIPISSNLNYIIDGERPVYASPPGLGSLGLTWETSETANLGVDAGFFQNKLNVTADIFKRKTKNMFGPGESLPNLLGTSVPSENNATLETNGMELTVGWKQTINDLRYDLTLLYSDNKSTVIKYNNPTKILNTYYEGMILGEIWGYETLGLFSSEEEISSAPNQSQLNGNWQQGDVRYKDLNNDSKITTGKNTADDPGDQKIIGNSNPRHMLGLRASASYKGFDINILFQGVAKMNDLLSANVMFGFDPQGVQHTSLRDYTLDYWTPENPNAFYPRPYITGENSKNQVPQTRYLVNTSYARLKNLQIGYTIPQSISNRIKTQNIRLFLSGDNLITFSSLPKGTDPEVTFGSEKVYPISKILSCGIEVKF